MDTDVCGLNKVICKYTEGGDYGLNKSFVFYAVITNKKDFTQEKPMPLDGSEVEFIVPSMPSLARGKYYLQRWYKIAEDSEKKMQSETEINIGFGDVLYVEFNPYKSNVLLGNGVPIEVGSGLEVKNKKLSLKDTTSETFTDTVGITIEAGAIGDIYVDTIRYYKVLNICPLAYYNNTTLRPFGKNIFPIGWYKSSTGSYRIRILNNSTSNIHLDQIEYSCTYFPE